MDKPVWSMVDLAWAAGIFEGEGWVGLNRGKPHHTPHVNLRVVMTDQDVVRRLHAVMVVGRFRGPIVKREGWRPAYEWGVYRKDDVQLVAQLFWPWLGGRRKSRFREAFREAGLALGQYT